jgi:hypothetical protein
VESELIHFPLFTLKRIVESELIHFPLFTLKNSGEQLPHHYPLPFPPQARHHRRTR